MGARRSPDGAGCTQRRVLFLILRKRPEHTVTRDARPEYQGGASKSLVSCLDQRTGNPSWGTRVARPPPYGIPR
jgi:hypothetical protein